MQSYRDFWNEKAGSMQSAIAAVDGSPSEEIARLTGTWSADQVHAALDIQASDHVLELGCGVGRIGRELAPRCHEWTGVDISQSMLDAAAQRLAGLPNVVFRPLQRTSLDMFTDNSFDKAYTVAVLCHMDKEDVYLYIRELCRVLRPGGVAYIETWNMADPVGWKRWSFEMEAWARADQSQRKDVARNQFSVPEEVELFTRHAGFEIAACYGDSAWVQMVAVKPGVDGRLAATQGRLETATVANTPQWNALFSLMLDVIYGLCTPAQGMQRLAEMESTENVALYRRYLLSLWQQNTQSWGPTPEAGETTHDRTQNTC